MTASHRFSRDDVISAGVDITAEQGLPALTLQAVAGRLGVRRPSLYHHLPGGLAELRTGVVDKIANLLIEGIGEAAPEDSIWERIERPMRRVRQSAQQYPGVLQYLLTTGRDERLTLVEADRAVRLFLESEFSEIATEAYVIVHTYVTGWIFAQLPSRQAAETAGLTPLAGALRTIEDLDHDQLFFDGLQAMLTGLLVNNTSAESTKRRPLTLRKRRQAG
jgi:AcrR family transcriptional regulator